MSPAGSVLSNSPDHYSQHRWHKKPSMLKYFHNDKRDDNSPSSSSNSDNSDHRFSGSNFSNGKIGGFGSNFSNGKIGGIGSNRNDGSGFSNGSGSNSNNSGHGSIGNNSGNNSNSGSASGGNGNNDNSTQAGGGITQFKTITATFSTSTSVNPSSFPSPTGEDNLTPTTSVITSSASLGSPSPSSTFTILSPTEQQAIHHVSIPLGSIIAIILGILFCITIAGVIYVVTRPKFGSLGRLWRNSRVSSPYLPSIASNEPKEIRDSSNLYRPYRPQGRPMSHSMFNLSSFQFGSQGAIAAHQGHRLGNNGTPVGGYDNLQTHIYSTRKLGSSSPKAERSLASLHTEESEDQSLESLNRIMSMMDKYHFERNSAVDSGQISPNPSASFPLNASHHNHADFPDSVSPETISGE